MSERHLAKTAKFLQNLLYKASKASLIKKLKTMSKRHQAKQQSFYNISYTKPWKAKPQKETQNDFNIIRPNSEVSTTQKPSHKKAIKQMPTPKTQKMYNHVHKLSHLLVQSSSNGNSSKYSWKRIHCSIRCPASSNTMYDYDGRNKWSISSPHRQTEFCL